VRIKKPEGKTPQTSSYLVTLQYKPFENLCRQRSQQIVEKKTHLFFYFFDSPMRSWKDSFFRCDFLRVRQSSPVRQLAAYPTDILIVSSTAIVPPEIKSVRISELFTQQLFSRNLLKREKQATEFQFSIINIFCCGTFQSPSY